MCANSLNELFTDGLKQTYYAEQQFVDALEELENQSSKESMQTAFSEHRSETQEHVNRLESVFEAIDEQPETKTDKAVKGLIEDHEEFSNQDPDQDALDRYNIAAGQKTEHYEIATYGNLIPIADDLGMDEVADTLEQNLREEQGALDTLSSVGEQYDEGQL